MNEMVEKLRSIIERQKDERGDMLYKNGIPDAWLAEAANRIEALESALAVGEDFANKCFSAWACGEPSHRVRAMLNAADEFRAALDKVNDQ